MLRKLLPDFIPREPIPKRLETGRLIIRKLAYDDAEEFYHLEKESYHDHLEPFSPLREEPPSDREGVALMKQAIYETEFRWDDGLDYRFVITRKPERKIIGQIGVTNVIRGVLQSAFVGYWISREHINHGYATEALDRILAFCFDDLRLHRVTLWIMPENAASIRVAEKLGLRYEGLAERALYLSDKWRDTRIYAVTIEEWAARGISPIPPSPS